MRICAYNANAGVAEPIGFQQGCPGWRPWQQGREGARQRQPSDGRGPGIGREAAEGAGVKAHGSMGGMLSNA